MTTVRFSLQVCPPGLHVTLGIFRLFSLLEDECHELDLAHMLHGAQAGPSHEQYLIALKKKRDTEKKIGNLKEIQRLEQLVTLAAITLPNPTNSVQYRSLCTVVATNKHRVQELVSRLFAHTCT